MNGKEKKEAEKLGEEAERRAAVAVTKIMGKLIEDIDRMRRLSEATSLIGRIASNIAFIETLPAAVREEPSLAPSFYELGRSPFEVHEGICEDFKKSLKMKDEDFNKLFPKVSSYFETPDQLISALMKLYHTEFQMIMYLMRYMIPQAPTS